MSIPFFAGGMVIVRVHVYALCLPLYVVRSCDVYLFKGVMRYLRNLHITYRATDRRVVQL